MVQLGSLTGEQIWYHYLAVAIKSAVIVGLLIATSRYAVMVGKASMEEAIKNSDRRHAISFGRFYLEAFGEEATWDRVKEVFQHWNIDKGEHLSQVTPEQFDPQFFEKFTELVKVLAEATKR